MNFPPPMTQTLTPLSSAQGARYLKGCVGTAPSWRPCEFLGRGGGPQSFHHQQPSHCPRQGKPRKISLKEKYSRRLKPDLQSGAPNGFWHCNNMLCTCRTETGRERAVVKTIFPWHFSWIGGNYACLPNLGPRKYDFPKCVLQLHHLPRRLLSLSR